MTNCSVIILNIFCVQLPLQIFCHERIFYLLPHVMYSVFCVAPCADITCTGYLVIDGVAKDKLE